MTPNTPTGYTHIVPVSATHLQQAVSLRRQHTDITVAEDVGEGEATFPSAAPTSSIKMKTVALGKIVPGSE
jgi:hypothetical protein